MVGVQTQPPPRLPPARPTPCSRTPLPPPQNRDEGVSLDGQNRSAGASFISRNQQQRRLANNSVPDSPAAAAAAHAASLRNSFLAGSGSGSGSVSGSEQRTESSFAIPTETPMPRQGPDVAPGLEDDECAKARRLPPAALVAQELLECEGLLRDAEAAANASLQKLTGEVESFRYNPASTEAREWRAWADETLREFAPVSPTARHAFYYNRVGDEMTPAKCNDRVTIIRVSFSVVSTLMHLRNKLTSIHSWRYCSPSAVYFTCQSVSCKPVGAHEMTFE